MSALSWLWHELTRPRGPVSHRFYRSRRRSRSGVALIMVLTTILFMTVLVTEMSYAAVVRLQLAAQQRDEVKAEALANTGVNIYRLVLIASKQLGSNSMIGQMAASYGISIGDTLWQMIPFINTGMLRMLLVFDDSVDTGDVAEVEAQGGLTDEQLDETRESSGTKRNFLDFDGDFSAEISDEDKKINVSRISASTYADLMSDPVGLQLYSLMSGIRTCGNTNPFSEPTNEQDDNDQFFYEKDIDRWELIANLADWTDVDNDRLYQGGSEDALYNRLEDAYLPKNAPMDSLDEIRLIDGWQDDDLWERYGEDITVYGGGKVNVNTAECEVMWALIKAYYPAAPDNQIEEIIRYVEQYRAMATFSSADAFVNYVTQAWPAIDPAMKNAVATQSTVFRVTSTGQVGEATVTIETVLDFSSSDLGKVVYWRIE